MASIKREDQVRFLGFLKKLQDYQFEMSGKLSVSVETDFSYDTKFLNKISIEIEYLSATFYSFEKPSEWRAKWDRIERRTRMELLP